MDDNQNLNPAGNGTQETPETTAPENSVSETPVPEQSVSAAPASVTEVPQAAAETPAPVTEVPQAAAAIPTQAAGMPQTDAASVSENRAPYGNVQYQQTLDSQPVPQYQPNSPYQVNPQYQQAGQYQQTGAYQQDGQSQQNGVYQQGGQYQQAGQYQQNTYYQQNMQYQQYTPYQQNGPYGQGGQYGYQQQPQKSGGNGLAITAMILGIASLVLFCTCLNIPLAIVSIILAIIHLVRRSYTGKGFAIAGIIMSGISIVVGIIFWVMIVTGITSSGVMNVYSDIYDDMMDGGYEDFAERYYYDFDSADDSYVISDEDSGIIGLDYKN